MDNSIILKYVKLIDKNNTFSDEDIVSMAELCSICFKNSFMDKEKYNLALAYLVLHELTVPSLLEQTGGSTDYLVSSVTSKKEGDLQINYGSNIKKTQEQEYYSKTPYGLKFLELTANSMPMFFVSNYTGD